MERSGFVVYPEYRFNPERLKELDDKGYAEYTAMLEKQKSSKQKEPERWYLSHVPYRLQEQVTFRQADAGAGATD